MGKTPRTLAAIDIGTSKVCSIIAQVGDSGAFRVLGVGVSPSKGLKRGVVINIEETSEVIRESIQKAERASGVKLRAAYIGVTGRHIETFDARSSVAISRNNRIVQESDVKRALQEARSVKLSADRQLLHIIPRGYALDGCDGVKNPVGMHGFRLDANAHVVSAAASALKNLVKSVHQAGVEVEDVVLEPLASAEAVLRSDEKESGVILLDIGGGTTDIAIFKEGNVYFTSILPLGGYQISRDIAIGLGISFEMAEEVKIKYGNLALLTNHNEVAKAEPAHAVVDGHEFLIQDLNEIIRARVEEILFMALAELPQQEYLSSLAPSGMVLTGGTANLRGIEQLAAGIFRMPVRLGIPKDIYGLADVLYNPAYATSVGLLIWGTREYVGEWRAAQSRKLTYCLRRLMNSFRLWK